MRGRERAIIRYFRFIWPVNTKPSVLVFLGFTVIALQIVDRSVAETWLSGVVPRTLSLTSYIFLGIMAVSIIFQNYLLAVAGRISGVRSPRGKVRTLLFLSTAVSQTVVSVLIIVLNIQVNTSEAYDLSLVKIAVALTYCVSFIILAILSYSFLRMSLSSKSKIIVSYAIAIAALSLSIGITFFYLEAELAARPASINQYRDPWVSYYSAAPTSLFELYILSGIASFLFTWIATVMLLNYYSERIGKRRYWILVCMPLAYFLSQFVPSNTWFQTMVNPIVLSLGYNFVIFSFKAAGGILFGVGFFVLARSIKNQDLKLYLIVTGVGMSAIFGSIDMSSLVKAPFPPFGLGSVTFLTIASFLLFVGLDSCSRYIATDASVRKLIVKSIKEFDLLKGLGFEQLTHSVSEKINYVNKMMVEDLREEDAPPDIQDEDIQDYVMKVIDELQKKEKSDVK